MRPLGDMNIIQIEVTNACYLKCANCTRHVGHHRKTFFMDLDYIEKAIDSLEGFEGNIGMMGGDPTLHPKFPEICKIYQKKIPNKRKREFWTSGFKWKEYQDVILETFDKDRIAYNEHSTPGGKHTPLLVSIDEVVEDKKLMWEMIDNCWIQSQWSAAITPKGGFFCEVAASLDYLFEGPGGYEIKPGWWKKEPKDFQDQVKRYCKDCSGALPMKSESDGFGGRKGPAYDTVSPRNLEKLLKVKSPKAQAGHIKIFNEKLGEEKIVANSENWNPSHFKPFVTHSPNDYANKEKQVDPKKSGKI
tara:strand:- start:344 stop:1252 length:909 start_codon:yes stop_codon:yes gene_type:complete